LLANIHRQHPSGSQSITGQNSCVMYKVFLPTYDGCTGTGMVNKLWKYLSICQHSIADLITFDPISSTSRPSNHFITRTVNKQFARKVELWLVNQFFDWQEFLQNQWKKLASTFLPSSLMYYIQYCIMNCKHWCRVQ